MAWIYESREILDIDEKPTGRYRYVGFSDDEPSLPPRTGCACVFGHATPKEAFDCPDAARERASAIDTVPRRNRVERMTAAELAIRAAISVVEGAGCHPLLTDAVVLLGEAQGKVADFVDR